MSDETHRVTPTGGGDERALRDALRALPTLVPPVSALPRLQAQWAAERRRGTNARRPVLWALAAGITALAIGVFVVRQPADHAATPAPEVTASAETGAAADIRALMAQSVEWEKALRRFEQQSIPMNAGSAMASAELEDLIGLTDLQLGAAADDREVASLWQRRVNLMSRLAEVRTQSAWERGNTDVDSTLLAATYQIN
jgi:hypothetical protein